MFYSNRAACYNALSDWEKVVEDTSAAIAMDAEYVKALNRRAHAYEHLSMFSEALLDYTASCIIDGFKNEQSAQSVERLLKKVAEKKGKAILEAKGRKLPSPTFVTNYLQSFRSRPPPAGLENTADLDENSGKRQLQKGVIALDSKTGQGYEEASKSFEKAVELVILAIMKLLASICELRSDTWKAIRHRLWRISRRASICSRRLPRASSKEQACTLR